MALSAEMKAVLKGLGYSDEQIAAMESAGSSSSSSSTTNKKPTTVTYPSVSSKTQANAKVEDIFNRLLDRDPTAAELKTWRKRLTDAQRDFAAKQTYTRKGGNATQATVGGLDEDYWLTNELTKDATYGPEIKRLALLDPNVRKKEKAKREYEAAVKNAGNNAAAVALLDQTTSYGLDIKSLADRIKKLADDAGAQLDAATVLQYAREAYDTNKDVDQVSFNKFINEKLQINPVASQYQGEAADNYQRLLQLGIDNGINIETDPRFKGQINNWLTQINAGAPIQNFEGLIRQAAAANQPAFVQSLLATGQSLRDIYGNYIARMAKYFNIDPSAIDLNDPILKGVFTDKGGMPFNQFESLLVKDARTAGAEKGAAVNNRQYVIDRALQLGVQLTEADIEDILNTAISLELAPNSQAIDKLIRTKFNYTPGKAFGGEAGQTLIDLRQTAAANGIDLDAQFGGQLDSWVEQVMQGESVDTFKNLIRQTAKIGMPQNVASLLDQGVDLDTVYSPYKNLMAKVLEISPETIQLDDPVLRSAITSQGEMSLYDYQRSLRKDPRWQYTDNAREETSNVALQVLRDFGFQG